MSTTRASSLPHVRPAEPLRFPEQEPEPERMGQGRRHFELCKALFEILCAACVPEHTVGADQFGTSMRRTHDVASRRTRS